MKGAALREAWTNEKADEEGNRRQKQHLVFPTAAGKGAKVGLSAAMSFGNSSLSPFL